MTDHNQQYQRLFPTEEEKAKAFDQIAEQFYFGNFGSISKTDLELLMFSIYLERLLDLDEENTIAYSDYTLSKQFAVPQSRIAALKVRKELKYPRQGFDWKKAYQRCAGNVRYEGGKIKIYISDRNVFLEIKNAIEEAGGYLEVSLTANLLQVAPEYYVDLMMKIRGEEDRKELLSALKKELADQDHDKEYLEQKSLQELFIESGIEFTTDSVCRMVGIPFLSEPIKRIATMLKDFLSTKRR